MDTLNIFFQYAHPNTRFVPAIGISLVFASRPTANTFLELEHTCFWLLTLQSFLCVFTFTPAPSRTPAGQAGMAGWLARLAWRAGPHIYHIMIYRLYILDTLSILHLFFISNCDSLHTIWEKVFSEKGAGTHHTGAPSLFDQEHRKTCFSEGPHNRPTKRGIKSHTPMNPCYTLL